MIWSLFTKQRPASGQTRMASMVLIHRPAYGFDLGLPISSTRITTAASQPPVFGIIDRMQNTDPYDVKPDFIFDKSGKKEHLSSQKVGRNFRKHYLP